MVATLRHPNIVTIFDRGDFDGRLWISMEYVDGTDAWRLPTERYPGGIPAAQVVAIVRAIADALGTTPTAVTCCTAISSRPTSSSEPQSRAESCWLTSVLRAGSARPAT